MEYIRLTIYTHTSELMYKRLRLYGPGATWHNDLKKIYIIVSLGLV